MVKANMSPVIVGTRCNQHACTIQQRSRADFTLIPRFCKIVAEQISPEQNQPELQALSTTAQTTSIPTTVRVVGRRVWRVK